MNADGLSNDRAFVFDPRATNEGELRAGISAMPESAPMHASRCLRDQLGRVGALEQQPPAVDGAAQRACHSGSGAHPLQNRGVLQLRLLNMLAGVDQLVHGSALLHPLARTAYPDPVLLQVRGFDPAARRYRYTVNRSFGDTPVHRALFQSPFRVAIALALNVGPHHERVCRT